MFRHNIILTLLLSSVSVYSQQDYIIRFIDDSTLQHASVSLSVIDAKNGDIIARYNEKKSLSQASVMKLVTTAAALEMLGPDYSFKTEIGFTGKINRGRLDGDIVIKGGGDPTLGSEKFNSSQGQFMDNWIEEIKKLGIRKIAGKVLTDDSRYDYQPVPPNWNWEDIGNYYGAGVYGLNVFDNTIKIHFRTGNEGSVPVITNIEPAGSDIKYVSYLKSYGASDQGYVYLAPYSKNGWISGSIPVNMEDFVLKASVPDPPFLAAALLTMKLRNAGIKISGIPSSVRTSGLPDTPVFTLITSTTSPALSSIIEVLNHESVNLYAEALVKELGKVFIGEGTTSAGTEVVKRFLDSLGVDASGMFIKDGSGLSPQDAVTSEGIASLLYLMKKNGRYFETYYSSLPEPGKEGTLKNNFKDPVFESSIRAKSGTILRVKSYAGYIKTKSGRELVFSIIVNNYIGTQARLISRIEELLKEVILHE